MKKTAFLLTASLLFGVITSNAFAQTKTTTSTTTTSTTSSSTQTAGGDVLAELTASGNYTALSLALRAANLSETLKGAGPFTVFAPTNDAFSKLSSARLDELMKDPAALATALKYHVVAGKYSKADIIKALSTGKGKASLKTIDGQTLTLSVVDQKLQLADDKGNTAQVTAFDLNAGNGVIHGINAVLTSK